MWQQEAVPECCQCHQSHLFVPTDGTHKDGAVATALPNQWLLVAQ